MANLLTTRGHPYPSGGQPRGVNVPNPSAAGAKGRAMEQMGRSVVALGKNLVDAYLRKERNRQFNQYRVAKLRLYNDYRKDMTDHPEIADTDGSRWKSYAEERKKDVLGKQPFDEMKQDWDLFVENMRFDAMEEGVKRHHVQLENQYETDWENAQRFDAPPTDRQVVNAYETALDITRDAKEAGLVLWQDENVNAKRLREYMHNIAGQNIISQAQESNDPKVIDGANDTLAYFTGGQVEAFTAEELKDLKKQYAQYQNILDGEKNDRAEVFDKDTRKKILAGGTVLPNLRNEILNNPDLSGPQMNTLVNLYDERAGGAGTKYSNEQKLAAYAEIVEEDDPTKKLQLLFKHAGAFTPEKAQSLYDSINNPTAKDIEDSSAGKFMAALVNQAGFGTDISLVTTQKGYMLLRDAIDAGSSSGKPLTDDEKKQKVLEIFNNLKQDVNEGRIDIHPVSLKKLREPSEIPLGLTLGLGEIWDQLDDASKLAALDLRAKGATAEDLIAHFKKKTGK